MRLPAALLALLLLASTAAAPSARAASLVSAQLISSMSRLQVRSLLNLYGAPGPSAANGVDQYHIVYNTTDAHGLPTVASGALLVPTGTGVPDPVPLVSYTHGTVLLKASVPSRLYANNAQGLFFAAFGYVATMTDYLGLGDSPGLHPYHHGDTQASAAVDLIRVARPFLADSLGVTLDGSVYLTGYSQGGHAAMATHKYVEENGLLGEFDIRGCAPLSGAYYLSGGQFTFAFEYYAYPGYVVYLFEGLQTVYGNLYATRSEFYDAPYDTTIPTYLDGMSSMGALHAALPDSVHLFMQDSVLVNALADPSHPVILAVTDNDNHNWLPARPVRMAYCEGDEQVSYLNAIAAEDTMTALGAASVEAVRVGGPAVDHSGCFWPAMEDARNWFDALRAASSAAIPGATPASLSVRPNPATGDAVIAFSLPSAGRARLSVYDVAGRRIRTLLDAECTEGNTRVRWDGRDASGHPLPAGVYFVRMSTKDARATARVHRIR
ncbi:MAG: FlgD immunoglobulin-like domain containing protein [Gemmatimonadota bacterium]|nr:FlgD immunoglobulin-like domain containing protein [Gemmatimonadota bacterium]MDP6803112.1 FlgD immunoglobulin-like domain containing protein [Gemmatimonadota bacterium]